MTAAHNAMHRKWFAAGLAGFVVLVGSVVCQQAFAQTTNDYDTDDDNLIEVRTLEQLDAIRYDLDGDGAPSNMSAYAVAFPTPATPMCNTTCRGYELMADLNFDTSGDGMITAADNVLSWGNGLGWQPIGTSVNLFESEFNGNGHAISRLFIHSTDTNNVGLFGFINSGAVIRSVGLIGADVAGSEGVGGLVGDSRGTIDASYVTGEVRGDFNTGGLVGQNSGTIRASYATSEVGENGRVGGLVGFNQGGTIHASYAIGEVSGNNIVGGLVGVNTGTIRASYATGEVSGSSNVGGLVGGNSGGSIRDSYFDTNTSGQAGSEGKTTEELQEPTSYTVAGIYADWNVDVDNADGDNNPLTGVDDPWHFGTSEQYPALQVDFDGDNMKSWEEFGPQSRIGVAVSLDELPLTEGETGSYTVVLLTVPTTSVTVAPESGNPAAVSVSVNGGNALTFMPGDWNTPQTVTVRAVEDDANAVGEVVSLMHAVASDDLNYASVTAPVVIVRVTDNDEGNDYDVDDDNLIEVRNLEQLNAIRYDLDGNGTSDDNDNVSAYATAFPNPETSMGCPATCTGYELMANLDFDETGDGEITTADGVLAWGSGSGWQPIGTIANSFIAEFNGNGHTISHLFIKRTGATNVGLFGFNTFAGVIRNVGLVGVDITGNNNVGSLVGRSERPIDASYATGVVSGNNNIGGLVGQKNSWTIHASYATGGVDGNDRIGGLVGLNIEGIIRASYATGGVNGNDNIGGLVGRNNSGIINASYATGVVTGNTNNTGGLVGAEAGSIQNSYFDANTSGQMGSEGTSTAVLQEPTTYTGIYANWNLDLDNDSTTDDDPWDFGTSTQYPLLQVDFNGDGDKSWEEFGPQSRPGGIALSPRVLSLMEGSAGTYTVVLLTMPTDSVTVTPKSSNTTAVSVSVNSGELLTFTPENWDMEQTVTVSAVHDMNTANEVVSLTHAVDSNDTNYMSLTAPDVTVRVTDNGANDEGIRVRIRVFLEGPLR